MAEVEYTYAVARVRALEVGLFSQSTIDQLLACKTVPACISFLTEHGWGGMDVPNEPDAILSAERAKTWATIREMGVPMDTFDVLSYPNAFHNLKTAIKEVYMDEKHDDFYYEGTVPSREELREIISKKEFSRLPENMEKAAEDAFDTILHTRDGQLCDAIIDKACLEAIEQAGQDSKADIIKTYAETEVSIADIKIAVRSQKTGKSIEFMNRSMAHCKSLDTDRLAKAAVGGFQSICDYLTASGFGDAVEALKVSPSNFEKWCDNYLIDMMRPQKYEAFTVGPLVAYILARENEIKTVGIILSGKENGLSDDSIRERTREMYV